MPYLDIRRARFTWRDEIVRVAGRVDTEHDLRLIFTCFSVFAVSRIELLKVILWIPNKGGMRLLGVNIILMLSVFLLCRTILNL